jgi:hypothetical protein
VARWRIDRLTGVLTTMNLMTLRALTWVTVAAAVVSALLLAWAE